MHETLQVVDVQNNAVEEWGGVEMLGTVGGLYSLDLRRNFIGENAPDYRKIVCYHIPQLKVLDGRHVGHGESASVTEAVIAASIDKVERLLQEDGRKERREREEKERAKSGAKAVPGAKPAVVGSNTATGSPSLLSNNEGIFSQTKVREVALGANISNIPPLHSNIFLNKICYATHYARSLQDSELSRGIVTLGGGAARSILKRRNTLTDDLSTSAFASSTKPQEDEGDSPQHLQKDEKQEDATKPTQDKVRPHTSTPGSEKEASPLFFRRPHTALGVRGNSGVGFDGRPNSASSGGSCTKVRYSGSRTSLITCREAALPLTYRLATLVSFRSSQSRGLLVGTDGPGWSPDKFQKQRRHYVFNNKKSGIRLIDIESDESDQNKGNSER